jgi:hypothetical protein
LKSFEEIKSNSKIRNIITGLDGGKADIHIGGWDGSVIWSTSAGWDHVPVCPYIKRIIPSWDDMCQLKEIFFNDDEAVIQIHPEKDMYVNNMPNCLHLWKCTYKEMILPPSCLVGLRKDQTRSELHKELVEAYKLAGETYE